MAVQLTTSEQKISTAYLSKDGCDFELKTYAWYAKESSTVARVYVKMTIQCQSGYTWYGTNNYYRCYSTDKFDTGSVKRTDNVTSTKATIGTWSYTKTTSGENTIVSRWSVYGGANYGEASQAVYVPASEFVTAPSTPSVTLTGVRYNSVDLAVSISSYGNPSSADGRYIEGAVLNQNSYGGTYRYNIAYNTTSANITVTNSNSGSLTIAGNSHYWYGGYATNLSAASQTVAGDFVTPCPPLTSASFSSQSYTAYNRVSAVISWARNTSSDNGYGTRYLYYRYSTNGGSSWTSNIQAASGVTASSGTFTITNLPTATNVLVELWIWNSYRESTRIQTSFTTRNTHTAPNFSNFTYQDTNSSSVAITGNNQTMIQGISDPKITISTANKATGNDGVAVSNYSFNFSGRTATTSYSSSSAVEVTLGKPTTSGSQTMSVTATDALSLSKAVTKSVTVYPWQAPQPSLSAVRTNNFESETTISINGTWSPITISGTDRNTLLIEYRYKKSSESTWGAWTTRPHVTNGSNWTTTDLVLSLDNAYQWDVQARATDSFTNTVVSVVVSVGQPLFFIGADGRVSVGGKPTKALVSGKNGQLEVKGQIHIPDAGGQQENSAIYLENSTPATDTMTYYKRTDTGTEMGVGIGTGGINQGIWSKNLNDWLVYADENEGYLANNTVKTAAIKDNAVEASKINFSTFNQAPSDTLGLQALLFTNRCARYITDATDVNTLTQVGRYFNSSSSIQLTNKPSGANNACTIFVIDVLGGKYDSSISPWLYNLQIYLDLWGNLYYRPMETSSGTTWRFGSWKQVNSSVV